MKRVFQSAALLLVLMAFAVPGLALASCATGAHQHGGCNRDCPMMQVDMSMPGMSMAVAGGSCCQMRSGEPTSSTQQAAATTSHDVSAGVTQASSAQPSAAVTNVRRPAIDVAAQGETPPSLSVLCTFLI